MATPETPAAFSGVLRHQPDVNRPRLTLAQLSVPEKNNEITAIPELLDHLAATGQLEGALVTIGAMGCQVEIAAKIAGHKADFMLALKGNHPTLESHGSESRLTLI